MEDYSLSALAKGLGRAKSGLHKLAKNGQIPKLANGRFDLAAVQKALAANIDPGRRRVHLTAKPEQPSRQQEPLAVDPIETLEAAAEAVSLIKTILAEEGVPSGAVDYNAARTAELILKARERHLKMQQQSGELVDAATIRDEIFKLSRQNRDSWSNWPSRAAPLIAAELGVPLVTLAVILEKHVRLHQVELGNPNFSLGSEHEG